jgi:gas vesicle protein
MTLTCRLGGVWPSSGLPSAQSVDHAAGLRAELDQIRGVAEQLGDDYAKLRDASRGAREDSAAATEVVQEVERKLERLGQLVNESQTKLDAVTVARRVRAGNCTDGKGRSRTRCRYRHARRSARTREEREEAI